MQDCWAIFEYPKNGKLGLLAKHKRSNDLHYGNSKLYSVIHGKNAERTFHPNLYQKRSAPEVQMYIEQKCTGGLNAHRTKVHRRFKCTSNKICTGGSKAILLGFFGRRFFIKPGTRI